MLLNGDLIFYWIYKKYPKARHILGRGLTNRPQVSRPMFWGSPEAMRGHFVVLNTDATRHIVQYSADAIFLCIGADGSELAAGKNEYIVLPQTVPTEQVFNYLLEIFDLFAEWEQRLQQAVNVYLSYDAIIRSCDQLLQDPLALTDTQFHYVGYSKRLAHEIGFDEKYGTTVLPPDVVNILTSLPERRELDQRREVYSNVGVENMRHKNVFYDGEFIGKLSIFNKKNPDENAYYSQILLIVANYVEQLYAKLGTFWHRKSSDSKLKKMLYELMRGTVVDTKSLNEKAGRRGRREDDLYCLVQLKSHFSANEDKLNSVLSTHIEDMWPGCLGLIFEERFYFLVNLSEFQRKTGKVFKQELAYFLRESLLIAGLSRPFRDLAHLRIAGRQANIALEFGEEQDPGYWYFNFDDYAFAYLLYRGYQGFRPEQIIAPEILRLLEYDRENGSELNRTLEVYLRQSYNAVAAAKELSVARSTFLNRLDRIEKLTKLDLHCYEKRVYLALSYTLIEQFEKD